MRPFKRKRSWLFVFRKKLEPGERLVPLLRDGIQIWASSCMGLGSTSNSVSRPARLACTRRARSRDAEVFGHGLAREFRALGQLRDRVAAPAR